MDTLSFTQNPKRNVEPIIQSVWDFRVSRHLPSLLTHKWILTSFFNCCNIYLPPNWFIVTQFAICMLTRLKKNLISKEVHKQNFCFIPKIIVGRISMYFKAHTWVHILLDFTKLIANATHTKLWI